MDIYHKKIANLENERKLASKHAISMRVAMNSFIRFDVVYFFKVMLIILELNLIILMLGWRC